MGLFHRLCDLLINLIPPMRGAALLDILFPLKFSCMEHHSSNPDTGKTEKMSVLGQGGTAQSRGDWGRAKARECG